LWGRLDEASLLTVKTGKPHETCGVLYQFEEPWLTARLPSGRKIYYFNPQKINRVMPWDKDVVKVAWTYQQMKTGQWKTIDAFGGLLTENVVQGLARDLMVEAMFKLPYYAWPHTSGVSKGQHAQRSEEEPNPAYQGLQSSVYCSACGRQQGSSACPRRGTPGRANGRDFLTALASLRCGCSGNYRKQ